MTCAIKTQGLVITGKVLSAHNFGTDDEPNWYIELTDSNGKYRYYKQVYDGGTVTIQEV